MNLTIERVYPKVREWSGQYGPAAAVKVLFTDGTEGDYLTKPDKAQGHIERLQALVGKPSEFEIDPSKEREYNGVTQRVIKSYPGKPEAQGGFGGGGGGGGRQFVVAYHQTKEGQDAEQERMDRRTALMQAVAVHASHAGHDLPIILRDAEQMYAWLRKTSGAGGPTQNPNPAPAQTHIPAPAQPSLPVSRTDAYSSTGHERSRPAGSTADSVEEAARRSGMGWIKEWMQKHELDPNDVALRRYLCGTAIAKDLETCKDLSSGEWQRIKNFFGPMPPEGAINLVSHFNQRELVLAMGDAGKPDDADPFADD